MRHSLLPAKDAPLWLHLVRSPEEIPFTSLPARMLMMRIKVLKRDGTPSKVQESIEVVYDFFTKNELSLQEDIELLISHHWRDHENDENTR